MEFKEEILIQQVEESGNGWLVVVQVGQASDLSTTHNVQLDRDVYERLTEGRISPGELVEASFQFLLEREPKESIQRNFDLDVISTYFPEFEKKLPKYL